MFFKKLCKTVVASVCAVALMFGTLKSFTVSSTVYAAEEETTNLNLFPVFERYQSAINDICGNCTSNEFSHIQMLTSTFDMEGRERIIALGAEESSNEQKITYKIPEAKVEELVAKYFEVNEVVKTKLHAVSASGLALSAFQEISYSEGYYYLSVYYGGAGSDVRYNLMAYDWTDYDEKLYTLYVYKTHVVDKADITSDMKEEVDYIVEGNMYRKVDAKYQLYVKYDGTGVKFFSCNAYTSNYGFTKQYIKKTDVIEPETRTLVIEKTDFKGLGGYGSYSAWACNYGLIFEEDNGYMIVFSDGTITHYTEENCPALKKGNELVAANRVASGTESASLSPWVYDNKSHTVLWVTLINITTTENSTSLDALGTLTKEDGSYASGFDGYVDLQEAYSKMPALEAGFARLEDVNYKYQGNDSRLLAFNDVIGLVAKDEYCMSYDLIDYKNEKVLISNIEMSTGGFKTVGSYNKDLFFIPVGDTLYKVYYKEVAKDSATSTVVVDSVTNTVKCETTIDAGGKQVVAKADASVLPSDSVFRFALPVATSKEVINAKTAINKYIVANKEEGKDKVALSDSCVVWDIDVLAADSVTKIQPLNNGKVSITVPKAEGLGEDVVVYRFDGTNVVVLEAKVVDNTVVFETDHFSYFVVDNAPRAITEEESSSTDDPNQESAPISGDNTIVWPLLLVVLLSGLIVIIASRKTEKI